MRHRVLFESGLLLGCAALASACGGCGDEPPAQTVADVSMTTGAPDMGTPEPDAPTADMPVVTREVPGGLLLRMTPGRDTYPPGIRLLPEVETFDAWGDPADFAWEMTVEPAGAATLVGDRYELAAEGIVRFVACTVEPGPDGAPICGWDEVVVDVGPPTIEITAPARGAMLDALADPVITVEGRVTDSFGEISAFLNGVPLTLGEDGSFSADIAPRFGINHIEVAASDGLDPRTSTAELDVLWAAGYDAMTTPPVNYPDAVNLRLGQRFMDDRARPMTAPDGTTVTQDLADIMELVIRNFDIAGQIDNPVVDQSGFSLSVPSVAIGKPLVQIDIVDGGLELFVQLADLRADTTGFLNLNNTTLNLDGDLAAPMSALVVVEIDKASPTDPIVVTVESVSVAIEGATPNFASPEANAVFELASSALRTTLESLLLDTLEGSFIDELPALLSDVFTALDDALSNQSVELDTGLGAPITLNIDGDVQTLAAAYRDHLTASLSLLASTSATALHPSSRGTALLAPAGPAPFFDQARVQFGLNLAMVNSLLHALWQAGLLEADVTNVVPVNVDAAAISARLPPVVRPPLEGEPHDLVLELGQLEVETEILGRRDRYGVSVAAGLDFGLDQGALSVSLSTTPTIRTWLVSASEETPFLTPQALHDLITNDVWPQFTAAFAGGLSINLPAPDLSGLGAVAAPLGGLTLEYKELRPLAVRDGWVILDATMEGTLPP